MPPFPTTSFPRGEEGRGDEGSPGHTLHPPGEPEGMRAASADGTPDPWRRGASPGLPKLVGGDFELGNSILGLEAPNGTGCLASHLLLREIAGLPLRQQGGVGGGCPACRGRQEALASGFTTASLAITGCTCQESSSSYNPQDWARKFLRENGGCAYIDLDHLELCLPEVWSAHEHLAVTHALLRTARVALQSANAKLPKGARIVVLANNSDGQGHSYGSHLNVLITRRAWNNLFKRRLQNLLFLGTYQASSIVFTGQGKVGSENGKPPVPYQISQRADFLEVLMGVQTTFNRPMVNSRDEALCGSWRSAQSNPAVAELARLHVIFYDTTLCHAASLLKVGVMQIILAMIEAEAINLELILEDPLEAVLRWSHDPSLQARARLASGRALTAVEVQMKFLDDARRFVAGGGCDGVVANASFILELWEDTLRKLQARDYVSLSRRLDWVLKWHILERARHQRPDLDWSSPQLKHLDLMYGSLEDGLYWAYERGGLVDMLVTDDAIERFRHEPPDNTRAWTRAMLLRLAKPEQIARVDWDSITFRLESHGDGPREATVNLSSPLGFGKAACESVFRSSATLEEALELLGSVTSNFPASDLAPSVRRDPPAEGSASFSAGSRDPTTAGGPPGSAAGQILDQHKKQTGETNHE